MVDVNDRVIINFKKSNVVYFSAYSKFRSNV